MIVLRKNLIQRRSCIVLEYKLHRLNFEQQMFSLSQQVKISCVQYMVHCSNGKDEFRGGVPPIERLLFIIPCLLTQGFTLVPVLI